MILENYSIILIENERTTADRENTKVKETERTADKETGGKQTIIIIVLGLALGLVVIALIVSILIKVIKDKIIKANTETEEFNENYGNLSPEEYYMEERNTKIEDTNDYYR